MPFTVTRFDLYRHFPCNSGWAAFIKRMNDPHPEREITIPELLDSGIVLRDVVWALRALPDSTSLAQRAFLLDLYREILKPIMAHNEPDELVTLGYLQDILEIAASSPDEDHSKRMPNLWIQLTNCNAGLINAVGYAFHGLLFPYDNLPDCVYNCASRCLTYGTATTPHSIDELLRKHFPATDKE